MSETPLLSCRSLRKTYRMGRVDVPVLRDASLDVSAGEWVAVLGSSGSGKSTILKLATRLYDVSEGEILIDGHDIRTLKLTDLRQAVSVLFQDYTHFPVSVSSASCAINASQPISTY